VQPYLIGIAGPSGAGKSELARHLSQRFGEYTALVSLDSYYRPMDHLPLEQRAKVNFDHPDALDWDLIRRDVDRLTRGEAILEPIYLFDQHTRAKEMRRVDAAEYVIVEGLFALYDEHVRSLFDARIFVYAPDEVCLARRIERDTVQRGRTRESVLAQYAQTVRPMAERYVLPTQDHADLIVSGENPLEESWAAVQQLLLQAA
jgi:uridine kinase